MNIAYKPGDKVLIIAGDYFNGQIGVIDIVGGLLKVKLEDKGKEYILPYHRRDVMKVGD